MTVTEVTGVVQLDIWKNRPNRSLKQLFWYSVNHGGVFFQLYTHFHARNNYLQLEYKEEGTTRTFTVPLLDSSSVFCEKQLSRLNLTIKFWLYGISIEVHLSSESTS